MSPCIPTAPQSPSNSTTFITTTSSTSTPTTKPSPFLTLPPELRNQIYTLLFPSSTLINLTIRSLFIRTYYRNIYMTQQRKDLAPALPLLRVCRQITKECLSILYAGPTWKCGARIEELGSQIGFGNFARIRRMEVGYEDLGMVLLSLNLGLGVGEKVRSGLRFDGLEELRTEGYQAPALMEDTVDSDLILAHNARVVDSSTKRARLEAVRLCDLAKRILSLHPVLDALLQVDEGEFPGGDALDLTYCRVKWRFVRSNVVPRENEFAVDLQHITDTLMGLLDVPISPKSISSLPVWMENGRYRQYPYLPE